MDEDPPLTEVAYVRATDLTRTLNQAEFNDATQAPVTVMDLDTRLLLYATQSDVQDINDVLDTKAGWADLDAFTGRLETLESDALGFAKTSQLPDMSLYTKTVDLPAFPDLTPYAWQTQLTPLALQSDVNSLTTTVNDKVDATALTPLALAATVPSLASQLTDKLSAGGMASWMSSYLNTNPSSWATLRAALVYAYSLSPTIPLTHEYLPLSTSFNAAIGATTVTRWTDVVTKSSTNDIVLISGAYTVQDFTSTRPLGVLKTANGTATQPSFQLKSRGTIFLVYSWNLAVASTTTYLFSHVNLSAPANPRIFVTRANFNIVNTLGTTKTVDMPPMTDTVLNTPYIVAVSWDFLNEPSRLTLAAHNVIDEHIGTNATSTRYTFNVNAPDTPNISSVTGVNLPYWVDFAGGGSNIFALLGSSGGTGSMMLARMHYVGIWKDKYLNIDEVYAVHTVLRARYCTAPFDRDFLGILS